MGGGTPQKEALKEEAGEWADPICLFKGTLDPAEDGVERGPIHAFHFISCRKTSLGVQNHPARGDNSREVEGGQWVRATCWGWAQPRGMMIKMWGLEGGRGRGDHRMVRRLLAQGMGQTEVLCAEEEGREERQRTPRLTGAMRMK